MLLKSLKKVSALCINGEPIHSNDKPWCVRCGQLIVDANKSYWEVFVKDAAGNVRTQSICVFCNEIEISNGGKKQEASGEKGE